MRYINSYYNSKSILFCIIVLAAFLRIWRLTDSPPSLYWDEVSQAYNAYSILETGKDEHGEFYPLVRFKAFGDYKAPTLIYLIVPSIALFGKTDFAIRFPSALLGTATVLITYFMVLELFAAHKKKYFLGIISALLLAISPWHIQLSRGAYEGNVAQFFLIFGMLLFFVAIRKKPWILSLSALCFVLSMYSFNAHRFTVPILALTLGIVYFRKLLTIKKQMVLSIIISIILLIPLVNFLQSPDGKLRFNEVNIFSDLQIIEESNWLQELDNYSLISKIIHNRRVLYAQSYMKHYFDFFNPTYLFISGDGNPRFSSQETGQLYLVMLPFIILGFYALSRWKNRATICIFLWFIIAPLVAATARETPHALRSITYIPTYEIISAFGIIYSLYIVQKYLFNKQKIYKIIIAMVFIGSLFYFMYTYIVHTPRNYAKEWQYGYKETIEYISSIEAGYDHIIFTNTYGRPYIYVAYYGSYTPEKYQALVDLERDSFGFYNVYSLDKYVFTNDIKSYLNMEKSLFIETPNNFNGEFTVLKTIYFPNGEPAFIIGTNN